MYYVDGSDIWRHLSPSTISWSFLAHVNALNSCSKNSPGCGNPFGLHSKIDLLSLARSFICSPGSPVDILQTILLYFHCKYVVNRETTSDVIMATIFVVAIVALPLWTWTSRRLNKRLAYILGMAFFAAVLLVLFNMTPTTPLWSDP